MLHMKVPPFRAGTFREDFHKATEYSYIEGATMRDVQSQLADLLPCFPVGASGELEDCSTIARIPASCMEASGIALCGQQRKEIRKSYECSDFGVGRA
jgi:hypothetical protein